MARKKIIFIIVEGSSEKEALSNSFSELYSKNDTHIEITYGDITSKTDVENISVTIRNLIDTFINKTAGVTKQHIKEIIHLVDTDGVFINDGLIQFDEYAEHPIYSHNSIKTAHRDQIIKRNENKRHWLNILYTKDKIYGIPYHTYYMSCNLDHVLYNIINASDEEKTENSEKFSIYYENNLNAFITFISNSSFSVCGDYKKSWEFIKKDANSLNRFTNLSICIDNAINKK